MTDRPTLRQLANGNAIQQWTCERCGGQTWWVIDSRFVAKDGTRRRTRECRRCHHAIHTIELPVSTYRELVETELDE